MGYGKREAELERKFYRHRMELVDLSNTAPVNKLAILKLSCLAWELKQKYRVEGGSYYVSRKSYEEDLERNLAIERKLIQGGAYEAEALEAVKEAKEYLELIAGYRVRKTSKNRVF